MPRRFHDAEELFPPATALKRALAIIYDGLISIAVLLVATWGYTMVAGWITGWDRYEQMAEAGQLSLPISGRALARPWGCRSGGFELKTLMVLR